jgi:hypothetical protein
MRKSFWAFNKDKVPEDGETGQISRRLPVRIPTNLVGLATASKTKGTYTTKNWIQI